MSSERKCQMLSFYWVGIWGLYLHGMAKFQWLKRWWHHKTTALSYLVAIL